MIQKLTIVVLLIFSSSAFAQEEGEERTSPSPMFAYTHLLPTPFTLPAGRLAFGTQLAFGVTDFFQIGTDILRDFYQIYNANAKAALVQYPKFAFSITLEWIHYNFNDISDFNPDAKVTSWLPGGVAAFEIARPLALFVGGKLNFTQSNISPDGIETSGFVRGATVQSDLSWAYNPHRGSRVGNVLSAGVSYDINYELFGLGISHHWSGFQIGVHYYPNADERKLYPILVGGGSVQL